MFRLVKQRWMSTCSTTNSSGTRCFQWDTISILLLSTLFQNSGNVYSKNSLEIALKLLKIGNPYWDEKPRLWNPEIVNFLGILFGADSVNQQKFISCPLINSETRTWRFYQFWKYFSMFHQTIFKWDSTRRPTRAFRGRRSGNSPLMTSIDRFLLINFIFFYYKTTLNWIFSSTNLPISSSKVN